MKNEKTLKTWLFNPFYYIAGRKSLILGICTLLLVSTLGYLSNTHFDGILDIHYGNIFINNSYKIHILYQLIYWIIITVAFFIAIRLIMKKSVRIIDIMGTTAMSQLPLIIAALWGFIPFAHIDLGSIDSTTLNNILNILKNNIGFLVLDLIIIFISIVWSIVLKFNAFSTLSNIKGIKAGIIFTFMLMISEIISKIFIYLIYSLL